MPVSSTWQMHNEYERLFLLRSALFVQGTESPTRSLCVLSGHLRPQSPRYWDSVHSQYEKSEWSLVRVYCFSQGHSGETESEE